MDAISPTAHFEGAEPDAGLVGVGAEQSVALVTKQWEGFASKGGHEQAGFAFIAPVAKIGPHAGHNNSILGVGDERFYADLIKPPPAAILEQKIPFVVVCDKDIHPSVVVVVGNR